MTTTKRCITCKIEKPVNREHFAYQLAAKDGFQALCLVCQRAYAREWRKRPEVMARKNDAARRARKRPEAQERARRASLRKKYGLEPADYYAMLARQDGRCAICGVHDPDRLQVDHSHETRAIRDLLCGPCNKILGHCDDRTEVLIAAARYLERHRLAENPMYAPLPGTAPPARRGRPFRP